MAWFSVADEYAQAVTWIDAVADARKWSDAWHARALDEARAAYSGSWTEYSFWDTLEGAFVRLGIQESVPAGWNELAVTFGSKVDAQNAETERADESLAEAVQGAADDALSLLDKVPDVEEASDWWQDNKAWALPAGAAVGLLYVGWLTRPMWAKYA